MIDAVVADYDTPELAERCVASLDDPLISTITVIDAKARGWSYAQSCNYGASLGTAPYVLLLNADTRRLESQQPIVDLFASDPSIAVIGPRQVDEQGRLTAAGIFGTNTRPEHRLWLAPLDDHDHDHETGDTRDAVTVAGSVYFARRAVWDELGGFLDTPHFYEETFLSYAARNAGYRVLYTGSVTWEHLWDSSGLPTAAKASLAARSREIFRAACAERGIECD
ncbi:MAG TPA: glycosyltransferase [Conexibacter sp.]|jgi:GT2 family glycosyltransferase|nr:glycosyltransferase [Conexibacter sp.]